MSFLLREHRLDGKVNNPEPSNESTPAGPSAMEVITDLQNFPQSHPMPVLTIGNFDGVHRGHQVIFQTLIRRARAIGGTSVVLTFDPHPLKILAPERCPPLITPTAKKLALMQACDLDCVVCLPFTHGLADLSPSTFVEEILLGALGTREIFVGYDFAFGKGRQGTIALLQRIGQQAGFLVHTIEPISVDGRVVSSSGIRQGIQQGHVEAAALLLGRLYSLTGTVVEGYRKGRELGFPTANVQSSDELIPGRGVYAVLTDWQGRGYEGVANIGYNPTFGRTRLSIEIHLFDFAAQLYGERVEVHFVKKIRDERTFPSVGDLVQQIRQDIECARTLLAAHRMQASAGHRRS
jgi:riboflavin kinase / FMN adenylyltransferase